jgi:hypothetical protein
MNSWDTSGNPRQRFNNFSVVSYCQWLYHDSMGHYIEGILPTELLSGNKSESGADIAVANVATLSEHAFEAPRKGSDLNPVPTAGGSTDRSAPVASLPVISSVSPSSRLDRVTYDVEQKRIETEIGLLHERLDVRPQVSPSRIYALTAVIPNNT